MKHKSIILNILLALGLIPAWGQTELVVKFNKGEDVFKTKDFKFSFQTSTDTTLVFNSIDDKSIERKTVLTSLHSGDFTGKFEFTNNSRTWTAVEYSSKIDTNNLKRIEISLYFDANDKKIEFLQDFSVDQFYTISSVSIQNEKLEVGSQPVFTLVSNSDTTFWGASPTNHFYGTIKTKTELGWSEFSGSYCMSTALEKPLTKADTVFSWIPTYNPGNEYTIKRSGIYRYIVPLGLEKFSIGSPAILIDSGQTRKRTRQFFEVETEFRIE